jgi:hypothetical protein
VATIGQSRRGGAVSKQTWIAHGLPVIGRIQAAQTWQDWFTARLVIAFATALLLILTGMSATTSPALAGPAHASVSLSKPVVRSKEQLRQDYLVAAHFDKVRGRSLYETAIRDEMLASMYRKDKNLHPVEARKLLNVMWKTWSKVAPDPKHLKMQSDHELRMAFLNALTEFGDLEISEGLPAIRVGFIAAVAREVETKWGKDFREHVEASERLELEMKSAKNDAFAALLHDRIADRLRKHAAFAASDDGAKYAQARRQMIGVDTGVQLDSSREHYRDTTPALKAVDGVRALTAVTGALRTDVATLTGLAKQQFESLNKQISDVTNTVNEIYKDQTAILLYINEEQARREAERLAAEAAARYQLRLDGARASVYLLSTLIGLADPKLGRQVETVGNAGIQIVDSIVKYMDTVPKLLETSKALGNALAGAVLTGNIVSAVLNVVSLFADTGPTPEQLILNEVREMRRELGQFRSEMHDRFDRIDRGLNAIYSTLISGLEKINESTGRIEGGVTRLTEQMTQLRAQLDRFEANFYEIVSDQEGRKVWLEVARALGFKETGAAMGFARYFDHAKFFRGWAAQFAFDSIAAGPAAHALDPDQVALKLSGPGRHGLGPLDQRLNYLADYVEYHWPDVPRFRRSTSPLTGAPRLPSLNQWALGARAFAALATDWPMHAARIPAQDGQEIVRVGESLKADLGRISRNRRLFQRLFQNHQTRLAPVLAWIEQLEQKAVTELGLDPFSGAMQRIAKDEPEFAGFAALPPCSGDGKTLAPPHASGAIGLLPAPHRIARYLAHLHGTAMPAYGFDICWRAEWTDSEEEETAAAGTCVSAVPIMHLELRKGGLQVRERTLTSPRWGRCSGQAEDAPVPELDDVNTVISHRWTNPVTGALPLRSSLDGSLNATPTFENDPFVRVYANEVEREWLVAEQKKLYGRIAQSLATSPDEVVLRRLTGATLLIDAFVSLGFPRTLERHELMNALLHGSQGILSNETLLHLYKQASTTPPNGNLRLKLTAISNERLDALRKIVYRTMQQVSRGTHDESHALIEIALMRLQAAEQAARPAVAVPADTSPARLTATVPAGQKLPAVLGAGLRVRATCSEPCRARLVLRLATARARTFGFSVAAGKPAIIIGQLRWPLPADTRTVVIPFTSIARSKLNRATTLQLKLRRRTTDAAGNAWMRDQQLVLRR